MNDSCVVMFSGGRDSTLGAIRLANSGTNLTLVTISSIHLKGILDVKKRLAELKRFLPGNTVWMHLNDSDLIAPTLMLAQKTCLPCFLKYISVGVMVTKEIQSTSLAFGFTSYQNTWPEQTPYAVSKLKEALFEYNIILKTPVYDIKTKTEAIEELMNLGLSTSALEQKCSRQINNQEIASENLMDAIDEWIKALHFAISKNIFFGLPNILKYELNNL